MQYKPLWLINVRQKYAKYRFRYVEDYCDKIFNRCSGFAKDFSCGIAAFIWVFEYARAWHRVVILTMVWTKCTKRGEEK